MSSPLVEAVDRAHNALLAFLDDPNDDTRAAFGRAFTEL